MFKMIDRSVDIDNMYVCIYIYIYICLCIYFCTTSDSWRRDCEAKADWKERALEAARMICCNGGFGLWV